MGPRRKTIKQNREVCDDRYDRRLGFLNYGEGPIMLIPGDEFVAALPCHLSTTC